MAAAGHNSAFHVMQHTCAALLLLRVHKYAIPMLHNMSCHSAGSCTANIASEERSILSACQQKAFTFVCSSLSGTLWDSCIQGISVFPHDPGVAERLSYLYYAFSLSLPSAKIL